MSPVVSPDATTASTGQEPDTTSKRDIWIVFSIVPAFYTAFGAIFFLLARTMPPPRPDVTTEEKVEFFTAHSLTIQIGFGILILIVGGAGVANGIVVYHMKRMSAGSTMAYVYLGGMAVGALPGCLLVAFCFLVAAFRPDRDPEVLALLYDLGCLSMSVRWVASPQHTSASPLRSSTTATEYSRNGLATSPSGRSSPRSWQYRSSLHRRVRSHGTARCRSGPGR